MPGTGGLRTKRPATHHRVPFYGRVGCGEPIDLSAEPLEWFAVGSLTIAEGEVLVQACGDSMDRVGIIDGVYLVVEPASTAPTGKIVIANLHDEGCTCKRYRIRKRGHAVEHWLWPESTNPEYRPRQLGAGDRVIGIVKRHVAEH